MKAKYSKVVISADTQKKINILKNFKEQLIKVKDDPASYNRLKKEVLSYIDSVSYKEMEVIGEVLHNTVPDNYYQSPIATRKTMIGKYLERAFESKSSN